MSDESATTPASTGTASTSATSTSAASAGVASSVPICRVPSTGEKIVRVLAGVVSLIGLAVGYFGPDWGYLISVFAALNVIQSAFTGFCPPEILYRWMDR